MVNGTIFDDTIYSYEKADAYVLVRESQYDGDSDVSIDHLMVSFDADEIYKAKESFEKEYEAGKTSFYYVIPIVNKRIKK